MKDKEDIGLYKKELALEKERVTLTDMGEFYESLEGKVIHTAINKSGGRVIVGINDKMETPTCAKRDQSRVKNDKK